MIYGLRCRFNSRRAERGYARLQASVLSQDGFTYEAKLLLNDPRSYRHRRVVPR